MTGMNDERSTEDKDWLQLAKDVLDVEIEGLRQVRDNLGPDYVRALKLLAGCTGRVVVTGVGKSGLVGRKIAATLSSTGTAAYFLHPVEGAHGDLGMIRQGDVVLAISNSGETDELNAILPTLISLGAEVISLTGNLSSTMARQSHVSLSTCVPREACTLGLAPTSSTTATLALGDALAVGLIEWKSFGREDFKRFHPGGDLGRQLNLDIERIMQTEMLPVIASGTCLAEALTILDRGGLGTVIVVDRDNRLLGIMTDGDLRRLLCRKPDYSLDRAIDEYMTPEPKYASLGQRGATILDLMERSAIMVLPVVDQDRVLRGVVHLHDLLGKGRFRFNGPSG
jgi:arabinose-5-phosphate isomerase